MFEGMNEKIIHFTRDVSTLKCKILTKISPDSLLLVRRKPPERSGPFHWNLHFPAHVGQPNSCSFWRILLGKEAAVRVGSDTILPHGGAKRSKIKNQVTVPGGRAWGRRGKSPCWRHPLWHRQRPWPLAPPTASASSPLLCSTSSATGKGKVGCRGCGRPRPAFPFAELKGLCPQAWPQRQELPVPAAARWLGWERSKHAPVVRPWECHQLLSFLVRKSIDP